MYNFKKMSKRKNSVSFRHEEFQRVNATSLSNIKRRKQKNQPIQNQLEKEVSSVMEEPPSTLSTPLIDNEIRDTLALIKKEISAAGIIHLLRLQQLLEKSMGNYLTSESKLTDNPPSKEELREFGSFCKI
jgi:hypothetical protein